MSIIVFISSFIFAYTIDVFLVGIAFHSLKDRFGWQLSTKQNFIILFFVFLMLENYLWPAFLILDVTYTIHNEVLAEFFGFKPNEPLTELFGFGMFEFITWCIQALIANVLGQKMMGSKGMKSI